MRLLASALMMSAPSASVLAGPEAGTLEITQIWAGEIADAGETSAEATVVRSWASHRGMGRGTAFIFAEWPVTVGGEEKKLGIELRYIVTTNDSIVTSITNGVVLGSWRGYVVGFRCQSGSNECNSVNLETGEVTFRNAVAPGGAERKNPESKLPGLRINGVWRVRLHLDRDGTTFK